MGRPRTLTDREIDWAYQQWLRGYTQAEIARALNVTQRSISANFKKYGLKKPEKPEVDYWEVDT